MRWYDLLLQLERDGWRASACVHLCRPFARFALARTGLRVPRGAGSPQERLARNLAIFLGQLPEMRQRVRWTPWSAHPVAHPYVDVLVGPGRAGVREEAATRLTTTGLPTERLSPPEFPPDPPLGVLNAYARTDGQICDLWLQFQHVLVDGVPMQERLDQLADRWGVAQPAFRRPGRGPLQRVGEIGCRLAVLDFSRLLRWRAGLFPRPALVSLLFWLLARRPEFAGRRFSSTVDIPARGGWPRSVGLVPIRPADYSPAELPRFAADFQAGVEATRRRQSNSVRQLQLAAPSPPWAKALAVRIPGLSEGQIGTVGISIIKEAEVFLAPFHPAYRDGYFAIGGIDPGTGLGAVSVKAPLPRVDVALDAFEQMLAQVPE